MKHQSVARAIVVEASVAAGAAFRMPVVMRYDASDPAAVEAVFRCGLDDEVTWVFARELLASGLSNASGHGDVRIWRSWSAGKEVLRIALSSPDGEAMITAAVPEIVEFLHATYRICPEGQEFRNLESELEALLSS